MKSLAALLFLFLVVPGSGQLAWDGLPFSTRLEFATLVLFVVVFASRKSRVHLRLWLSSHRWGEVLKPGLLILTFVKFATFGYLPLSDGFESCYRSLYYPIEDPLACEKSYELPLQATDVVDVSELSRVDHKIDFGKNPFDWSLPFVNEYPRLGNLWLQRIPFRATFETSLKNRSLDVQFLPILAIGEISATVGDNIVEVRNYSRQFLELIAVPQGRSDFQLTYQYRDDESSIPPDTAPTPRGPYALLKVGKPTTLDRVLQFARVNVEVLGTIKGRTPSSVYVTDNSGLVLKEITRPTAVNSESAPGSDVVLTPRFELQLPASALELAPLRVVADFSGRSELLGLISSSASAPIEATRIRSSSAANPSPDLDFRVWLDSNRDSFDAYTPAARQQPQFLLGFLLTLIDSLTAIATFGLFMILLATLRSTLLLAIFVSVVSWIAIRPLDSILPKVLGGGRELVVPYALISLMILRFQRRLTRYSFVTFLPLAVVLAYNKVFDHLRFNHDDQGRDWWGKLLFLWRDSDWFTTQGFARTIFVSGSLQGGESVFWFQSGPRYLALMTRLVVGENDVLVGLIMVTLGFLAVIYLACRFRDAAPHQWSAKVAFGILFMGFLFQGDQLITAFAFVGSSESPTWISLIAITGYIVGTRSESRMWLLVVLSGLLASLLHLRPNQTFVHLAMFALVLATVDRTRFGNRTARYSWMIATFAITASLSLLHNLFYGRSFVPFTTNASINYAFEWTSLISNGGVLEGLRTLWTQFRSLMYWRGSPDQNLAIIFWGAQFYWFFVVVSRVRTRTLWRRESLALVLPLTYILPMMKYQLSSYYPRHLVMASLTCLCGALLAWPSRDSRTRTGSELRQQTESLDSAKQGSFST